MTAEEAVAMKVATTAEEEVVVKVAEVEVAVKVATTAEEGGVMKVAMTAEEEVGVEPEGRVMGEAATEVASRGAEVCAAEEMLVGAVTAEEAMLGAESAVVGREAVETSAVAWVRG
mmetsp:Transcript_18806/g.45103  ORF Transcript_18806/g.45103 Transcript_18806/m.45103 type:complete len:116 (+) Transcript_18806:408-755(+)